MSGRPVDPSRPFIALLGGLQLAGEDPAQSFAELIGSAAGLKTVNLAAPHAGPDYYLSNPALLETAARAVLVVILLPWPGALTTPYYRVHSRRNDRVVATTPALRALFPEVELAEIHYVRHLHQVLERMDAGRHAQVARSVHNTWLLRMGEMLDRLTAPRILLSPGWPPPPSACGETDPYMVDRPLQEALRSRHAGSLKLVTPNCEAWGAGPAGDDSARMQTSCLPSQTTEAGLATRLATEIRALLAPQCSAPLQLGPAMACGQVA
ncbi:DUF6473 family protein [Tabrizicola caldifontis]|uniref:DUF6473 family protein n=1 Tax=Tabrizicola caldifontis TaxID=2528036 RepID=UPI001080410E|nr:DUF6473 family protein [Rhodobacter sp. YIM 73028]